jgi:hypothetical protein
VSDDRLHELQIYLRDSGRYSGQIDGVYGPLTKQAIVVAMEDGPDTRLTLQDYRNAAARLGCRVSAILALADVEANGAGFAAGKPKILFEPHRFSKLTNHRFDQDHPNISYPNWGERPYPKLQDGRYAQLLEAVGLDVWAGFSAASYGKFQILGENHLACGYDTPWWFAFGMAYDELAQLEAFEGFIRGAGILAPLRGGMWAEVAQRYNGIAFRKNQYDVKLAQAAHRWEMDLAA